MPHLERYWTDADPAYCDGVGTESFGALLRRAEAALARFATLPSPGLAAQGSAGDDGAAVLLASEAQAGEADRI